MIESLQIKGYRCFNRFEMGGLGRINLLVGTNNSGKTSILEGLFLLASAGDPVALWQIVNRRGERAIDELAVRRPDPELDVSHLFHGHELNPGASFTLSAKNQTPERSLSFALGELRRGETVPGGEGPPGTRMAIHITGSPPPVVPVIPLTRSGGVTTDALDQSRRRRRDSIDLPSQYIATESLSMEELSRMWGKVALTDSEERVLRALQFLDGDLERIAVINTSSNPYVFGYPSRGGFMVKRKGEPPIPIGTMGDGMWRMLALAIAIGRSKDGVLLIDEIDTGLHYTVMVNMWKLVAEAANALNVQVFATTHSYDCIKSLAAICRAQDGGGGQVTIQRIEPARNRSVPYTEDEIKIAAERHIEVR